MVENRTKTVNKKRKYGINDHEMFYIRGGLNRLANSYEETNQPRMAEEAEAGKRAGQRKKENVNVFIMEMTKRLYDFQ